MTLEKWKLKAFIFFYCKEKKYKYIKYKLKK